MKIGDISKSYAVSIDTLRFYDKIGLLVPKRLNGVREYSSQECGKLEIILLLKNLSFTLDEIEEIIQMDTEIDQSLERNEFDQGRANQLLMILENKFQQFVLKEEEIKKAKQHLTHLMDKIQSYQPYGSRKKQVKNEKFRHSNFPNWVWVL